jgi:hypothetical protein
VAEVPVVVDFCAGHTAGPEPCPETVRYGNRGLTWAVREVLEEWAHSSYPDTAGVPGEHRRYQLRVQGPLPWRPGQRGEFIMIIRLHGGRAGWWASPA